MELRSDKSSYSSFMVDVSIENVASPRLASFPPKTLYGPPVRKKENCVVPCWSLSSNYCSRTLNISSRLEKLSIRSMEKSEMFLFR